MKASQTLIAIPLALAALYPPSAPVHAQPQQQQAQPGQPDDARKPATAPAKRDQSESGNGTASPAGQAPANPAAASPAEKPPQPIRGQGTVKGSRANPAPDGTIPGGKAGSGGHKTNEFGR
ncbi:MAG: hypothetical protein ACN6PJ_11270 [Achromobacter sp.]|uniref:hypothetical protein n=1 Tax=Achromobacter sp. TaxID=134375 RepID=UPI003D0736B6